MSAGPDVRVVDATLHEAQAPIHVVVTGLEQAKAVLDAVSHAGANARLDEDGRLHVVAKSTQLVDAAGRTGGAQLAEPLRDRLDAALAAWGQRPAPLPTPAGVLPLDERPVVMGVVNVTPDSFSDGGAHEDADAAVAHGERLLAVGADVLDVGGESTRPGADPVSVEVELRRVLPVVERLAAAGAVVSIDTSKAAVAQRAVAAGAAMVNDVSAGRLDDELLPTVAGLGVPYVLMHMRGTPRTMQDDPDYADVIADVFEFLAERLERAGALGLDVERVVIDPGIGFGKTTAHNLELLAGLRQFTSLGRPVLVGASRKRFLGEVAHIDDPADRDAASAAAATVAVANGASIVRVHDVAGSAHAVRVAAAVREAQGRTVEGGVQDA